jgi:hypothetical protein
MLNDTDERRLRSAILRRLHRFWKVLHRETRSGSRLLDNGAQLPSKTLWQSPLVDVEKVLEPHLRERSMWSVFGEPFISEGAMAVARTMGARCCRSGSWR